MIRIFLKIAKSFLGLFLLISSSTSWAATFTFNILNSGDSVKNPITITSAYYEANCNMNGQSGECVVPECYKINTFSDVKVTTGQETISTYDPEVPAYCYDASRGGYPLQVILHIQAIDNKGINGSCTLYKDNISDPLASVYVGAIKIIETNDRFYCEFPVGTTKK